MYKKLSFLMIVTILFLGYGFSQENYNFFENDLYTDKWIGYNSSICGTMDLEEITEFPETLKSNTIYVLKTGNISIQNTINVGNCTAIMGSHEITEGTIVNNSKYSGDIFVITGSYIIMDNIVISGANTQGQYGIKVLNTNSVTLNNIKVKGLFGGIYFDNVNNSKLTNGNINGIYEYPIMLNNSHDNYLENIESSNNIDEAGLQIENSFSNIINHVQLFNNKFQGLLIYSGINNKINNLESYNNAQQGIYIFLGNGNVIDHAILFENKGEGIYLSKGSYDNKLSDINVYNNSKMGIVVFGTGNKLKRMVSDNNENGISIYSSDNTVQDYKVFNNKVHGILIMTGSNNIIDSGYIYNNSSHGILLYNASNNTIKNTQNFNNGQIISGSSRCGIMLYGNSNKNYFKNTYIYNNLIGICFESNGHTISNNTFEDIKIFNNNKNESSNGKSTGNIFSGVITTFDLIKTGNSSGKVTKTGVLLNFIELKTGDKISLSGFNIIKPGISLIQWVVAPSFEYMINPHVKDKYLFSWGSEYSDIIGYNSKFLNINDKTPEYSVGIMLQNEISGNIVSNGKNIVANGNIESFEIGGQKYEGNKIKYPFSTNTENINELVATNINGKDIHAILVLDIEAPTCEVVYSTTGATTENVIATLTGCSEEIAGTDLSYPFTKNGTHTFEFTDLVGNSGSTEANVSRIKPKPSGNGVGGGGGGGGNTVKDETHNAASDSGNNNIKFSFYTGNFDSDYSEEMNMAYQYAYYYKITTQKPISAAGMDQGLTRIAMAKMLSMYAINVLGMRPNNNETAAFNDVSYILNSEYNNGVSLAYQLGIMGINMPNNEFRPFDPVTRAEFATALSRLLYGTKDGTDAYYSTHLDKLLEKGIISNTNPDLQELRGYVMIMLMRSALGISSTEDFVYPEPEPQGQEVVRYFTEPYKKGQIYSRIGDLQDLLRYLGYYKLGTNYVYSKATINAVYDFQVDMGLIDADDINNPAKGYLGPETRKALNEKWAEFQRYKTSHPE